MDEAKQLAYSNLLDAVKKWFDEGCPGYQPMTSEGEAVELLKKIHLADENGVSATEWEELMCNAFELIRKATRPTLESKTCEWENEDGECDYKTQCGNRYMFLEGTPKDNEQKYCGYCGGVIIDITGTAPKEGE